MELRTIPGCQPDLVVIGLFAWREPAPGHLIRLADMITPASARKRPIAGITRATLACKRIELPRLIRRASGKRHESQNSYDRGDDSRYADTHRPPSKHHRPHCAFPST